MREKGATAEQTKIVTLLLLTAICQNFDRYLEVHILQKSHFPDRCFNNHATLISSIIRSKRLKNCKNGTVYINLYESDEHCALRRSSTLCCLVLDTDTVQNFKIT